MERWAKVIIKLAEYQDDNFGLEFTLPDDPPPVVIINAPDYQEERGMEIEREMRQAPRHQKRVT